MSRLLIRLLGPLLLMTALISQADQRIIELKDGSRIQASIILLSNGVYTIRSDALGQIKLDESQVEAIYSAGSSNKPAAPTDLSLENIQSTILGDQSLMGSILNLQDDPDVRAVLNDPEVMNAVRRMDLELLRNHPKIKRLMNNSKVKEIQYKVN